MNKLESTSIQKHIKDSYQVTFPFGGTLIVGVSGGPDSMALLYLLQKNDIPVFVVHINYGLRGDESDDDQQLVEDICSMWDIECCSVSLKGEEVKGNFQDWARKQRYQIFKDLKNEIGAAGIAIAHHADDQHETILFKILRGGGASSWKGLRLWEGEIFRPLLDISKSEIIEYCETEAVPFRVDASNESNDYARNAFRNLIAPVFHEFIPGWKSNLKSVGEKAEITDELISILLSNLVEDDSLKTDPLANCSPNLKVSIIKRFILNQVQYQASKGQLHQAVDLLESQTGKEIQLSDDLSLVKGRASLILKKSQAKDDIEASITESDFKIGVILNGWNFKIQENKSVFDLNISVDQIKWPLQLRKWESGDQFQPFGMAGTQKISDHLTNRKINASQRQESLILIDSGGTICAILYPSTAMNGENGCISEIVKITQSTTNILSISKT